MKTMKGREELRGAHQGSFLHSQPWRQPHHTEILQEASIVIPLGTEEGTEGAPSTAELHPLL